MSQVRLHHISKSFGSVAALDDVTLDVATGEFMLLLGPSGSGKTTLLRLIGGYERPTRGQIEIDGQDITRLSVYQRHIGMVFQNYALFPHLTVAGNVGFGLEMRGVPKADRQARIDEVLDLVQLWGLGMRYPAQLSGGQQQRVALARAIAYRPALLLLDEPLANLDRRLRDHMRVELKQLQRHIGITTIMVTHDQEESLTLADRIAVLSAGTLAQCGEPQHIYNAPASPFVATFMGDMNMLDGVVESVGPDGARIRIGGVTCLAPALAVRQAGQKITLGVRAERIQIGDAPASPNRFLGVVQLAAYQGQTTQYDIALGAGPDGQNEPTRTVIKVIEPNVAGEMAHTQGEIVQVFWPVSAGVCFGG